LILAAILLASAAVADEAAPTARFESRWGYALADELMSPWCPGFALSDCSSGYAAELRLWILEQERLGRSEDEVRAEILAKYGEKMLQAPRARGRGLLAYAIPAAIILAGLALLVAFLRRQGRAETVAASPDAASDRLALARVDDELAHFERARD
jgi:cytochrome c-type biogenesis protein CcmH